MRQTALILIFIFLFALLQGCEGKITEVINPQELSPPLGLKSITGDENVILFWYTSNYEDDLVDISSTNMTAAIIPPAFWKTFLRLSTKLTLLRYRRPRAGYNPRRSQILITAQLTAFW
jgi:hypothetical protein